MVTKFYENNFGLAQRTLVVGKFDEAATQKAVEKPSEVERRTGSKLSPATPNRLLKLP